MIIEEELFCHDKVYIEKLGIRSKQYPANFNEKNGNKYITVFQNIDVMERDNLIRLLPNEKEEIYTVLDVSYRAGSKGILSNGLDDISPQWILMLQKNTTITKNPIEQLQPIHIENLNISGGNQQIADIIKNSIG